MYPPRLQSNKKINWEGLIYVNLALSLICLVLLLNGLPLRHPASSPLISGSSLPVKFYSAEKFQKSIARSKLLADTYPKSKTIFAAVVPHDLSHAEYLAYFFQNLSRQNPSLVVLIGPNHWEAGSHQIQSASQNWSTAFGSIETDKKMLQELTKSVPVKDDPSVLYNEHSISGLIPYLAYYLPGTKVLPLTVKSELNLTGIRQLSNKLTALLPSDAVVVASVDFSHFLTSAEADKNDRFSEAALSSLNAFDIISLGARFNDYLDSPPSIGILLTWLKQNKISHHKLLFHANSGKLANNYTDPVTSYFVMAYY